jgi:hypothetical protein
VLTGGKTMLNLIINVIGAVCLMMLVWCLVRAHLRNTRENSQAEPNAIEDYLEKIKLIAGLSAYDTFRISGEEWRVSADRIEQDFRMYLSSQNIPYYVKDFVRKGKKHIDELYRSKGSYFSDKRLLLFYLFLTLFFWGGALILSLYVIPYLVPLEVRSAFLIGPR